MNHSKLTVLLVFETQMLRIQFAKSINPLESHASYRTVITRIYVVDIAEIGQWEDYRFTFAKKASVYESNASTLDFREYYLIGHLYAAIIVRHVPKTSLVKNIH